MECTQISINDVKIVNYSSDYGKIVNIIKNEIPDFSVDKNIYIYLCENIIEKVSTIVKYHVKKTLSLGDFDNYNGFFINYNGNYYIFVKSNPKTDSIERIIYHEFQHLKNHINYPYIFGLEYSRGTSVANSFIDEFIVCCECNLKYEISYEDYFLCLINNLLDIQSQSKSKVKLEKFLSNYNDLIAYIYSNTLLKNYKYTYTDIENALCSFGKYQNKILKLIYDNCVNTYENNNCNMRDMRNQIEGLELLITRLYECCNRGWK